MTGDEILPAYDYRNRGDVLPMRSSRLMLVGTGRNQIFGP
jgi:hypothetical protein